LAALLSLEQLHRRLSSGRPPILVEALGAAYYADAHLPGALNIPPGRVSTLAPRLLPDREVEIIVYCSSGSTNSTMTAQRLEELGYTFVSVYGGGKEEWVEHGLPVERTADLT